MANQQSAAAWYDRYEHRTSRTGLLAPSQIYEAVTTALEAWVTASCMSGVRAAGFKPRQDALWLRSHRAQSTLNEKRKYIWHGACTYQNICAAALA